MADKQNDTKYFEERIKELGAEKNWNKKEIKEKIAHLQNLKTPEAMKEYLDKLEQEDEQQPNNDNREDGYQSGEEKDTQVEVDEGQKDNPQQQKQPNGQEGEEKSQVPTDEFKEFLKDQKVSVQDYMDASPKKQKQLQDAFKARFKDIEPMRNAKSTTVGEKEEDTSSSQNSDWREMRRKAWKEYAKENDQPFEEISKAEDADLSMKVGDTPIHYQDKSHLTMGNGEYKKFVQAVKIEKADKTDIINFGNIQSEEYKQKLAAACIQEDMLMRNGPKSIDLSLECFKDLKPEVKDKIEAWNRAQEAKRKEQAQENSGSEENSESAENSESTGNPGSTENSGSEENSGSAGNSESTGNPGSTENSGSEENSGSKESASMNSKNKTYLQEVKRKLERQTKAPTTKPEEHTSKRLSPQQINALKNNNSR